MDTERGKMKMAVVTITDVDEQVKQNFEQTCSTVGMSMSAGINILMRMAIRESDLLFGSVSNANIVKDSLRQQQRQAVYDFIASNDASSDELNSEDYAEFESGKFKPKFSPRDLAL